MKNKAEINLSNKKKIYGLLRKIPKKNIFKPDNDIKENFWFSIDINQIQETMGKKFNKHVVFLEDKKVDTPRPKKITINISNNHLKYAITWYSISVSIFFYFLYFRRYQ
jgi:surfeit locus 1 family protein